MATIALPLSKHQRAFPTDVDMRQQLQNLKGLLFLINLASILVGAVEGQRRQSVPRKPTLTPAASACELTKAPIVRGISLGMSSESLFSLYPQMKSDYLEAQQEFNRNPTGSPLWSLGIQRLEHEVTAEKDPRDNSLAGLYSVKINFFEEKVMSLALWYKDFEPISMTDFVKQTAKSMVLPESGWLIRKDEARLDCKDFAINLSYGGPKDPALIQLQDLQLFKRWVEAKEQKRRVLKP